MLHGIDSGFPFGCFNFSDLGRTTFALFCPQQGLCAGKRSSRDWCAFFCLRRQGIKFSHWIHNASSGFVFRDLIAKWRQSLITR